MPNISVVRADETDADEVTAVLSAGFHQDPVSGWIFPDEADRVRLHPPFFRPFVELTLAEGAIWTTPDRAAVALWLPVDVTAHGDGPDLRSLYEPLLGAYHAERIGAFDTRSSANHPTHTNHQYLPFVAVRPERLGEGLGTALLTDRLADLDRRGVPSYLEASNERSAKLYARLGYAHLDVTTDLPGGPTLYPMWRDPARREADEPTN
ncbi:GNAT family N-acetyltransferase [Streptomyces sp. SID1121]|uniref:GNAT family N-acetyltransferase n=1 Tax=Streptomyces sp. SID1121 TaxID=3425888 RepID=UPI0040578D4A